MSLRLQKYIADCGVTSRRKAEKLIEQGKVKVNGLRVTEMGVKVDPSSDSVEVEGNVIDLQSVSKIYALVHKPRGYMTTSSDPEGRKTVMDLVKEVNERIYPVGRLDYLSEGLLLMTNDGDLANKIMHPSFEITKVYEVKVFGSVNVELLKKLRDGVIIDGGLAKPLSVRVIKQLPSKTWLEFRLNEGRNREIRQICEMCGITIDKLKRVAIEGLTIDGIAPGKVHYLNRKQVLRAIGMDENGLRKGGPVNFVSSKKSVNVKKRIQKNLTPADNDSYKVFRKDSYYEVVQALKEKKEEEARKPRITQTLEESLSSDSTQN